MPYSGPSDPKLPSDVKKLGAKKKRQWVDVFNSTLERCLAGKLKPKNKKGQTCEGRAFASAYSVVKGQKSMDEVESEGQREEEEEGTLTEAEAEGEKCAELAVVEVAPPPLGGATSFTQVDDYRKAQEQDMKIHDQEHDFRVIFDNIMAQPNEEMTLAQKATAVRTAANELSTRVKQVATGTKSLLDRAKAFLLGEKDDEPRSGGTFFAFKDDGGEYRWLMIATNKFVDKQAETFTEEAHKEYVEYVERTADFPELRVWHVPGSGVGRADFVDYLDGFRIDSGTFYKEFTDVAARLAVWPEPLGASHGYRYRYADKSGGVFRKYRTFDDTVLPFERAANPWTDMTVEFKEVFTMPLRSEKRAFLVGVLGEERTKVIEEKLPQAEKALEELGIGWKEAAAIGEALSGEVPAAEVPAPAAAAPAAATAAVPAAPVAATAAPAPAAQASAEAKPPKEEEEPPEADVLKDGLAELLVGQKEQGDRIAQLASDVALLQQTDEEKIAAKVAPRATKAIGAERPSQAAGTVAKQQEKIAEAVKEEGEGEGPAGAYVEDLIKLGGTGQPITAPTEPLPAPTASPDGK